MTWNEINHSWIRCTNEKNSFHNQGWKPPYIGHIMSDWKCELQRYTRRGNKSRANNLRRDVRTGGHKDNSAVHRQTSSGSLCPKSAFTIRSVINVGQYSGFILKNIEKRQQCTFVVKDFLCKSWFVLWNWDADKIIITIK